MNRNERRRLERQQAKSEGSITVGVAQTLQEALQYAEKNGMEYVVFDGMFYVKVDGNWQMEDIISDLLQFPQYKKLYDEHLVKSDVSILMAKNLLLAVFQANLGNGGEYDISNQI
jgi:hypothetical protein